MTSTSIFSQYLQQDGGLVGTPNILTSHNVFRAPDHVNRPIPVPSVYQDGRGEIHNLAVGAGDSRKRLNLLFTKKGVMRSGDMHAHTQHDFVFSGQVEVRTLTADGTSKMKVYGANEYIAIPPFVPHLFEFLQDTVLAEWWDGPFEAWFYQPYRTLVEASFPSGTSSTNVQSPHGRFSHYVLRDSIKDLKQEDSESSYYLSRQKKLWWWTGGVVVGLGIGYFVGTNQR